MATVLLCSLYLIPFAQTDTTAPPLVDSIAPVESVQVEKSKKAAVVDTSSRGYQNPGKAAMYSAVFPGLGQIYNQKYWKLPLVYGILGAGVYAITFNHDQYRIYLDAFYTRIDEEPGNDQFVGTYDERQLIELQNIYRRWRDLSIILTSVAYGLQILDAYVDAHLFYFDVSDDLSLNWQPSVIQNQNLPYSAYGVGLTLSFK